MINKEEIHRKSQSQEVNELKEAVHELGSDFAVFSDKVRAWDDLHRLTSDTDSELRWRAADALGKAFSHVPDKKQAWNDLIRLTSDTDRYVRGGAAYALGSAFSHVPDKKQAWDDLHRLTSDTDSDVRRGAAYALGSAFSHIPDKKHAWDDMQRLTSDNKCDVRIAANYSSGRVSISRASEAENEDGFRKEMENALEFFEKASNEATSFNPAKFCRPFYHSFYTLIFKKEDNEAEVQRYLSEAKKAVEGSESKEKLFEAVKNLGDALKEAQKARDFSDVKADLNAYRRYCDRACELLDTTEDKAPGASRLIRKGLPIIDERIKGIIAEIQEKAKAACQQSKGTPTEDLACTANREIQKWRIEDPQQMTWAIESLIFILHSKIPHNPENKHIHDKIEEIRKEEDMPKKLQMIANIMALIPSVIISNSTIGQVGNGQVIMN